MAFLLIIIRNIKALQKIYKWKLLKFFIRMTHLGSYVSYVWMWGLIKQEKWRECFDKYLSSSQSQLLNRYLNIIQYLMYEERMFYHPRFHRITCVKLSKTLKYLFVVLGDRTDKCKKNKMEFSWCYGFSYSSNCWLLTKEK